MTLAAANDRLAVWLAAWIGSMACFWALHVLLALPLIWPQTLPYVQYLSSGYFQAVALPALGVAGAISTAQVLRLIQETHDAVMAELGLLRDVHAAVCRDA